MTSNLHLNDIQSKILSKEIYKTVKGVSLHYKVKTTEVSDNILPSGILINE